MSCTRRVRGEMCPSLWYNFLEYHTLAFGQIFLPPHAMLPPINDSNAVGLAGNQIRVVGWSPPLCTKARATAGTNWRLYSIPALAIVSYYVPTGKVFLTNQSERSDTDLRHFSCCTNPFNHWLLLPLALCLHRLLNISYAKSFQVLSTVLTNFL